jgi:hypothetical protein
LGSYGGVLMSNVFNQIKLERAFEGYLESKDYENDLIEAAEKWIEKEKQNALAAEDIFFAQLAGYDLKPLILNTENNIIEDVQRETLLTIGEMFCAEYVQELFMEEPCYDY